MVNHGHRMDFRMLPESQPETLRIRPGGPLILEFGDTQPVQADHLGQALTVHAVIQHQRPLAVGNGGHQSGLDRGSAGASDEHRGIVGLRPRHKGLQQLALNPKQQFGELGFAMADIRPQQRLTHTLGHIDRTWIQ